MLDNALLALASMIGRGLSGKSCRCHFSHRSARTLTAGRLLFLEPTEAVGIRVLQLLEGTCAVGLLILPLPIPTWA